MPKLTPLPLAVISILICVILVACSGAEQTRATAIPAPTDTPAPQETPPSQPTLTTAAPLSWDDVPIYPGAKVDYSALTYEGTSPEGVTSEWRRYRTDDGFDLVVAFYQSEMLRSGWEQVRWAPLEPPLLDWLMEGGTYAKNDGRDRAAVEITDQRDSTVRIALFRAAGR